MTRVGTRWCVFAVNAAFLLLGLVLFELICQKVLFPERAQLVRNIDHRMTPGTPGTRGSVNINSDGIRSVFEADHFKDEDLNIIFLGDSFIFGPGLPDEGTVPQLLEVKARELHPGRGINVANFGWISSSPLLSHRLLKDVGDKYNPDVVILAIDMTDFSDDIKYGKLLERRGVYRLVGIAPMTVLVIRKVMSRAKALRPVHRVLFGVPPKRFFATENPLSETLPYFSCMQKNVDSIHAFCRNELGAMFCVVILPRHYQYNERECPRNWECGEYEILGPYCLEPFRYFERMRSHVDYPIHPLLDDFLKTNVFPLYQVDDPHWNAAGAEVAADAVYDCLLSDGCFD